MPLESGSHISDLNSSNPAASDGLGQTDDHLRLIKSTLLASFPNISGAVTATHTALNTVAGWLTSGATVLADAGAYFASDADTGVRRAAADQIALRAGGTDRVTATTSGAAVTGDFTASGTVTPTGAFAGGTGQLVPTGTVLDFAGASAPTGYLLCYGQEVSRTTYSALFTVLGTLYGAGDSSTTFNLPDCRGRVVAGQDDMGGTSANRLTGLSGGVDGDTLGAAGGAESHTLTEAQLAAHNHTATDAGHTHAQPSDTNGYFAYDTSGAIAAFSTGGASYQFTAPTTTGSGTAAITVGNSGSDEAHNNVQPTIIFNKIIKI